MLTYELKKAPGLPLYESLYRCIREDILSGRLAPGQKLPSKRALSQHLEVSKITVEGAYDQLLAEGFIRSREKVGYFVEAVQTAVPLPQPAAKEAPEQKPLVDLTGGKQLGFPFSVWAKLQRQVLLDLGDRLLEPMDRQGVFALRQAISQHLRQFRGMQVAPEQILIGAGTDFLYNILVQLLGQNACYGVEEPGYGKIPRLYSAAGARWVSVPMDGSGVVPERLEGVQVLHISPNHHFPTGLVTPLARRKALLQWARREEDRWIVEDDYDSEFRFNAHPMPSVYSLGGGHRVIYMNTFSRTLAPSIRIGYMVLPRELMARYHSRLGFYGCTVPSFEQNTLARFMEGGWFEKHINRMRKVYKARRNRLLELIRTCPAAPRLTIREADAGLHFLVKVDTKLSDEALVALCRRAGLRVNALSSFYAAAVPERDRGCLVIHYAGLSGQELEALEGILEDFPLPVEEK